MVYTNPIEIYVTNSAECSDGGSWESYATTKAWTLAQTNTTATVYVPAKSINQVYEDGMFAASARDIKFLGMENGYAVFNVGSGKYHFVSESFSR